MTETRPDVHHDLQGQSLPRFAALAAATLVATGVVFAVTPEGKDLTNIGMFFLHLVPFVLAVETIVVLDPRWLLRGRVREVLLLLAFLGFMIFLVPHLFGEFNLQDFGRFYHWMMITAPYVIIALAFAFRAGGAAPGSVRRFGYAALILMVSGLEDLFYQLVNNVPIPERWTWAQHMIVRLGGHVPTQHQAYAFIAVHVVLAVVVLTLPWRRRGTSADEPAAQAATPSTVP